MKIKKIPLRSCVVTHEKLPKQDLLRIVRTPEGKIVVDQSSKLNGRGIYIKKDITTYKLLKKNNIIAKKFQCAVDENIYKEIEEILEEK